MTSTQQWEDVQFPAILSGRFSTPAVADQEFGKAGEVKPTGLSPERRGQQTMTANALVDAIVACAAVQMSPGPKQQQLLANCSCLLMLHDQGSMGREQFLVALKKAMSVDEESRNVLHGAVEMLAAKSGDETLQDGLSRARQQRESDTDSDTASTVSGQSKEAAA